MVNSESTNDAGMQLDSYPIPAVLVTVEALSVLQNAQEKVLVTPSEEQYVLSTEAGQMSDFSNWGTSPMLTIDPLISSIGGNVYSALIDSDDDYGVYSGTSMATPNFAGAALLTLQLLREQETSQSKTDAARSEKALALLESSAALIREASGSYYSVRKQGTGMANVWNAASVYQTSGYIANPIQELGDDAQKSGTYSFTLTFCNESSVRDALYQLRTVLQCGDAVYSEKANGYINTLTTRTLTEWEDYTVSYSVNDPLLLLKKGQSTTVTVTVQLTQKAMQELNECYPNGTYIEGYVIAEDLEHDEQTGQPYYYDAQDNRYTEPAEDRQTLTLASVHATLLAYYGDWTDGDAVERTDFGDYLNAEYAVYHAGGNVSEDAVFALDEPCYTRPNLAFTATFIDGQPDMPVYYIGGNQYDIRYETTYDAARNAISTVETDGESNASQGMYLTLSQLRNLSIVTMTISDAQTGEVYYVQTQDYVTKCYYDNGWYTADMFYWDGSIWALEEDWNGEPVYSCTWSYVPSGTKVHVCFDGVLPWNDTPVNNLWSFDLMVDATAPMIEDVSYDEETKTLSVTASDENYLASIILKNEYGDIQDVQVVAPEQAGASETVSFDVSGLVDSGLTSVYVSAMDYATNESWSWSAALYETGKDATVTLVSADGTEEYDVLTGDYFWFTEPEAPEGYVFSCWTNAEVERAESLDELTVSYAAYDGVEIPGDCTFYALYAKGELVQFETPRFYASDAFVEDYSGVYAIVGLNTDEFGYYVVDDPQIFNENGETKDAADVYHVTLPELQDDYNMEFFSDETVFCYTLALSDDYYSYSIENSEGLYLALDEDMNLIYTDELTDSALWELTPAWEGNTVIRNLYCYDMILGYNEDDGIFGIWDDNVYVDAGDWGELAPSEWYYLWLYTRATESFITQYYTTNPTDEPDTPVDPIDPVDPVDPVHPVEPTPKPVTPVVPVTLITSDPFPFTDVRQTDSYYEAVRYLYEQGIMNGTGGNHFSPERTLNRAMVVTILYRLEGKPQVSFAGTFADVQDGQWYSDAIEWAAKHGIVNGFTSGNFAPMDAITREQLAAILQRYAAYRKLDTSASAELAANAVVSEWAGSNVRWAVALNLLEGGASVNAKTSANRAEVALAMYRFIKSLMK